MNQEPAPQINEVKPSYVKLAMRNMVRKGGKSLFHFFLTATGLCRVINHQIMNRLCN